MSAKEQAATKNISTAKENLAGFSILEIILSSALFALVAGTLGTTIVYSQQTALNSSLRLKAVFLAEEGIAAIKNIRDESFYNLGDGTYGLQINNGVWELNNSNEQVDGFSRSARITSNSTSSKDITVTVSWNNNSSEDSSISLFSRLTNWKNQ
ncbi:MAG: hypothetical protein JNN11_03265 [Candidatus Doudnabacteria bacterium]|nr:hypothetical protein [Candidatus Doudnabacteria bacterium]